MFKIDLDRNVEELTGVQAGMLFVIGFLIPFIVATVF